MRGKAENNEKMKMTNKENEKHQKRGNNANVKWVKTQQKRTGLRKDTDPGDFRQKSAGEIGKGHPQHFSEKFHSCMKERCIQMNVDPGTFR